ncbi:MAG TPA: methylmalonyl-CoA mutase family protein [Myxococcales bacterium]|nr:methylmalonyl-CoA mutase family protein [Myxococcales bacterium]
MAPSEREKLRASRERWRAEVYRPAVRKVAERRPEFRTTSGIELPAVLDPEAAPEAGYLDRLGWPGEYPFTRGVQPSMYRARHWTMRQYAGFGTAEESNRRYRLLLEAGQTGLSVAFDLPTQMGRDSDHARARGEVGRVGVAIDTLEDMETLLAGLPLDQVSTSMTINATASILLSLYAAVGLSRGVPLAALSGTVQNDVLKEYMARGTYIYPPEGSLRIVTDMFAFTAAKMPRWNPISISGYHIREAGSTAVQEVAFTLADGVAYVDAALAAGLDVDAFAGRLSFFFNVHNDFLEEVAKFRAARRLWARLMRERFHAKDPRSWALRFHAQTAGSTLTAQQPDNNVVRVSLQALAAVLGGCQSLHTNGRDEALSLPTEEAAKLALRTQQVIAYESGVADVVDPLGGAYAIERLTDEVEAKAEAYLKRIDEMGGMVRAIAAGFPQREIQEAAYQAQRQVEDGQQVVVGVNKFVEKGGAAPALLKVDPALEERQVARVKAFRAARDGAAAGRALAAVEAAARGKENLVPRILEAVQARATLGEISDALRAVFGEHREEVVL